MDGGRTSLTSMLGLLRRLATFADHHNLYATILRCWYFVQRAVSSHECSEDRAIRTDKRHSVQERSSSRIVGNTEMIRDWLFQTEPALTKCPRVHSLLRRTKGKYNYALDGCNPGKDRIVSVGTNSRSPVSSPSSGYKHARANLLLQRRVDEDVKRRQLTVLRHPNVSASHPLRVIGRSIRPRKATDAM
jgi:hypothetical protein